MFSSEELNENAAYAPDITWEAPSQIQDNLGGAIVAGSDDIRAMLVVEGGTSEINDPDLGVNQYLTVVGPPTLCFPRRRDVAIESKASVLAFD